MVFPLALLAANVEENDLSPPLASSNELLMLAVLVPGAWPTVRVIDLY